jgi:hypothetical protein
MALPSSGPLSLNDIQTEFGGSNPISLNEYYAGGSFVAAGTSGTYGAVPSSGTISIQNFYGTTAFTPRVVWAGGEPLTDVMDYVNPSTTGNAVSFGTLSPSRFYIGGCASSTRGLAGGGGTSYNAGAMYSNISYITIASTGNSTPFGTLTAARFLLAACNSATRGCFGGGSDGSGTQFTTIDYVTIASTGNAVSFGNLIYGSAGGFGTMSCSSPTRGIWAGGLYDSNLIGINYITIATTGNATSFGSLTQTTCSGSSCSNSTRGLFVGGTSFYGTSTLMTYITIATTGNATSFGSLSTGRSAISSGATTTRGLFGGGYNSTTLIDYATIATTGNATVFGQLTLARQGAAPMSNNNGGTQ